MSIGRPLPEPPSSFPKFKFPDAHPVEVTVPNHMTTAANRADNLVGGPTPHGESGWCLEWCVRTVYNISGPYRWGGNGANWAINYWLAAKKYGRVVETNDPTRIPRGAMTFSKGASKYGHVFIALGDGLCASTDYPTPRKIGMVRITDLLFGWGHRLLGYIEITGDGVDLRDPGPVDRMNPANYFVGAHGDHVLWLGQRLKAKGYPTRYAPTKDFTNSDLKAVAWFQRKQGWTGQAADGLPGNETLKRLAA
jgi:hypothetical protein